MASLILSLLLIVPLAGVVVVLTAHHFALMSIRIVLVMNLLSLALAVALAFTGPERLLYDVGGWQAPYGISLQVDGLSRVMVLLTGIVFTAAVLYQSGRELSGMEEPGKLTYHITFPMLLFAMNGLFLSADFFNFYVFFELMAVSSYLLVAMGKHHSLEAAWKYAAQSILSSSCLVAGIAFVYGVTGSLNMMDVAGRLNGPPIWIAPFILVAFLIKGSLFPFHWWQPDAHAGASTAGSAILAGILINLGIYGIMRFWPLLFGDEMRWVLLWVGTASVLFGAIAAWREADAKRLLGFSSTSQMGFILIALGWGTKGALTAGVLFMIHHSLSKAMLFLSTGVYTDSLHSTRFDALAGAGVSSRWIKPAFLLGFMSLVGLPPAIGFIGKLSLLHAGIGIRSWPWVAVVAVGSVTTLLYGSRAYHLLFWGGRKPKIDGQEAIGKIPVLGRSAIAMLAMLVLCACLYGKTVWTISEKAATDSRFILVGSKGAP